MGADVADGPPCSMDDKATAADRCVLRLVVRVRPSVCTQAADGRQALSGEPGCRSVKCDESPEAGGRLDSHGEEYGRPLSAVPSTA
jgi:hypothetical protein